MKSLRRNLSMLLMLVLIMGTLAVPAAAATTVTVKGGASKKEAITLKTDGTEYVYNLKSTQKLVYFKFKTNSYNAYYDLEVVGYDLSKFAEYIFRRADDSVIGRDTFDEFYYVGNMKPDSWYYLVVKNSKKAQGKLRIQVKSVKDEDRNSKASAKKIACGKTYNCTMAYMDDVDFYTFTAPSTGNYTMIVRATKDVGYYAKASFLRGDGSAVVSKTLEEKGDALITTRKLTKGKTYYIKVKNQESEWDWGNDTDPYKVRFQKKN